MNDYELINLHFSSVETAREKAFQLLEDRDRRYSLDQPFYNDPYIFRIEMEEVFLKQWLFAAMTCEIPNRGDYITVEIGQNPVLLVRDADGSVNAFHNVCRHRGSRICLEEKGKVANLVCPYHQWTYDLKGNLLFAGGNDTIEGFDNADHGLKKAHCATAGGFIFICLSEDEPENIQDFLDSLDEYMEPYGMENAKVAVESNIMEDANWKLVIENNRECYHCSANHPELLNSLLEWDDTNDPRASQDFLEQYNEQAAEWDAENIPHRRRDHGLRNRIVRMPLKKGAEVMTIDGSTGCKKLMGRIQNRHMGSMRILHLPNSWNHMQSDHCIVFRVLPISAQKTLVTTKWIVHKDAVEGQDYDVSKLRAVWDATNQQDRELAEENQRGINSIAYQPGPYAPNYEFGVVNFIDWYAETMLNNMRNDDGPEADAEVIPTLSVCS